MNIICNKRAKYIICLFVIICLIAFIWQIDSKQQSNFNTLRKGYEYMEEEKYQNAIEIFSNYLSEHSSEAYWFFIDLLNGENSIYSRSSVQQALDNCESNY